MEDIDTVACCTADLVVVVVVEVVVVVVVVVVAAAAEAYTADLSEAFVAVVAVVAVVVVASPSNIVVVAASAFAFEEIVDFETDFDSPYSPCSPLRVHHHHSSSIDADFADDGIDFADVVDDVRRHPSSFAVSVGPCVILQT